MPNIQKIDPKVQECAESMQIQGFELQNWLDSSGFDASALEDADIKKAAKDEILSNRLNQNTSNGNGSSSDVLARMEQSFQSAFSEYDDYLNQYEEAWASKFAKREKAVRSNVHTRIQQQLGGSDVEENFLSDLRSTLRSKFPVS